MDDSQNNHLMAPSSVGSTKPVLHQALLAPELISSGGSAARFAWEEFVYGRLRNPGTRRAYLLAVRRFLGWCSEREVELKRIAPAHVGRYLDEQVYAPATMKLHLAALRHFFDELVLRHVIVLNPAASVRGPRLQIVEGKTPEITVKQCRRLLECIDIDTVVGLRDRAIIAVLIYTAARVGAVAKLRRGDLFDVGDQFCLRLTEKGTKLREIPVRHDLRGYLLKYIESAQLQYADKNSLLFRTTIRRTKTLTENGTTAGDISRMVKRRLADANLSVAFSPHSFRVCTITDLLYQGVPLADVQMLAGHADPRTTRLYDRRNRQVTRNIVERISV